MTICERLFVELDKRGLTAYAMSKSIGVNTTTTTNWKQRGTDPPSKYIAPICKFLGCSLSYLLTGEETEQETKNARSRIIGERARYAQVFQATHGTGASDTNWRGAGHCYVR